MFHPSNFYDHVKEILNLSRSIELTKSMSSSNQKHRRKKSQGGNMEMYKRKAAEMLRSIDDNPYHDTKKVRDLTIMVDDESEVL